MSTQPTFTVFTPTYNRAYTLPGVYASLCAQTFRDFEWFIIDDGSTDGTEALVSSWQGECAFSIRYAWHENVGKHRTHNRGVSEARGMLFLTLDSDDSLVPEALERMKAQWDGIPIEVKAEFAGAAGLCVTDTGSEVGSNYPADPLDSNMFEIREKYRVTGEKCGFQRTDVFREFPFPEFAGERFITEATVWNRIARRYKTRYFNEVLRVYIPRDDGLSAEGVRLLIDNPRGHALYFSEFMTMPSPPRRRFRAAANFVRCSLHARDPLRMLCKCDRPWLAALFFPIGFLLYIRDNRSCRRQNRNRVGS